MNIDHFKTIFECPDEEKRARIKNLHPADRVSYYRWLRSGVRRSADYVVGIDPASPDGDEQCVVILNRRTGEIVNASNAL